METRIDARKKEFKKSFEDPRRKREDDQLQIRKAAREAHLAKKRQQVSDVFVAPGGGPPQVKLDDLPMLAEALNSNDESAVFQAAQQIRRLLSVDQDPPIQKVVDSGVVPRFVRFLNCHETTSLQFESAWALTNIASGNQQQTAAVIEAGGIPAFVQLLTCPTPDVREQAVWALGNIAGDSAEFRDRVLEAGALPVLLQELAQADLPNTKANIVRYGTWTLSNLCRGKPEPPFHLVAPALPILRGLLYASDMDILADACWALSYLSDSPDPNDGARIDEILKSGVCARLVELLGHPANQVQTPALRAVGNIVTGTDIQTQNMISHNVLPRLKHLLASPRKAIKKEACWAISNITAGSRDQIEEVIANGLIPDLVELLQTAEFEVKKEAAWAISNAATGGNVRQVSALVDAHCIKPLVELIDVSDNRVVAVALEAIENILKTGKTRQEQEGLNENPYVEFLEEAHGFEKLEKLQCLEERTGERTGVQQTVYRIVREYLDVEQADGNMVQFPPEQGFQC